MKYIYELCAEIHITSSMRHKDFWNRIALQEQHLVKSKTEMDKILVFDLDQSERKFEISRIELVLAAVWKLLKHVEAWICPARTHQIAIRSGGEEGQETRGKKL
jgi:hypothetical protein